LAALACSACALADGQPVDQIDRRSRRPSAAQIDTGRDPRALCQNGVVSSTAVNPTMVSAAVLNSARTPKRKPKPNVIQR